MMTIAAFNHLNTTEKKKLLQRCCGSSAWVDKMLTAPPAEDMVDLFETADENWYACKNEDWLEAFRHHPKIGDVNSLKEKFATTASLAYDEQSGVNTAPGRILEKLSKGNDDYKKKFGYIFIVCATGKSADEMLAILNTRLPNDPAIEINIAAEEQSKITKIRLEKLFT